MFVIDDLWKIIRYLKDGTTDPDLHQLTMTLATSEKEVVSRYFENILDQTSFASEDYRRFRSMLIDWYAALRTIITTQKGASDIHALPDEHLDELFRSFGFDLDLTQVPLTTKANIFLDLVNFYKRKGTPETLGDLLDYYGLTDVDIMEYWLLYNQSSNLVFQGESVRPATAGSTVMTPVEVSFEKMTENDPHWMMTEDDIDSSFLQNDISLPSKSPYFSLTSIFLLNKLLSSLAILSRIVHDQYTRYLSSLALPQDVTIKNLNDTVSLLEVYLASIYVFEEALGTISYTSFTRHLYYTGTVTYESDPPVPTDLYVVADQFDIDVGTTPASRTARDAQIASFRSTWSRAIGSNFLSASPDMAGGILTSINPVLKDTCDTWITSGTQGDLLTYLLGTLDNWLKTNISISSPSITSTSLPSLTITSLGLTFRREILGLIEFFKPYRSRLYSVDTSFSIQDRLRESVLVEDDPDIDTRDDKIDYARANRLERDGLLDVQGPRIFDMGSNTFDQDMQPPVIEAKAEVLFGRLETDGIFSNGTATGSELAPSGCCTSVSGEADVTTGWINDSFNTFESTTKGDEPYGNFSLHVIATENAQKCHTILTTEVDKTYYIDIQNIVPNADDDTKARFRVGTSIDDNTYADIVSDSTSWNQIEIYFVAQSTTTVLTLREDGDVTGDDVEVYVDTVSIKEYTFDSWNQDVGWSPATDGAGTLVDQANCGGNQSASISLSQTIAEATVANKYRIECAVIDYDSTGSIEIDTTGTIHIQLGNHVGDLVSGSGTHTQDIKYLSGSPILYIVADPGFRGRIDNVAMYKFIKSVKY